MNEHEWYSAKPDLQPADDWYKPRTETISAASKKKHRRVKILSLCLVFAILAGLSAAVFMNHRAKDTSADTEQSFPSDYKEYFRETYPTSEEASPVLIQKTAYTGSAQMNLVGGDSEVLTLQEVYQQNINSVAAVYSFLPSGAGGFMGTAIVISEDGLLITNAHVLEGCNSCYVILNGKQIWIPRHLATALNFRSAMRWLPSEIRWSEICPAPSPMASSPPLTVLFSIMDTH